MPQPGFYESDMLPGVQFKTYEEAQEAEDALTNKQKRQSIGEDLTGMNIDAEALKKATEAEQNIALQRSQPRTEPLTTPEGKPMARGFDLSRGEQEALTRLPAIQDKGLDVPYEQKLAIMRMQNPEAMGDYMSGLGSLADIELGGGSLKKDDWRSARSKTADEIKNMPEGPDKEKALVDYLIEWDPAAGYRASTYGKKDVADKNKSELDAYAKKNAIRLLDAIRKEAAKGDEDAIKYLKDKGIPL